MGTTYLVVNSHGGAGGQNQQFVDWFCNIDPDISLVSELGERDDPLREAGFHVLTGRHGRGATDVGIVIPKDYARRIKDEDMERLTRDLGRPIAPDRWYANMEFGRLRSLYSLHANAVIQDRRTGGWRDWVVATEWYRAMGEINRDVKADQSRGRAPVLGGDMNWRQNRTGKVIERSPQWLAKQRDLDYFTTPGDVMWLMWSAQHFHAVDKKVIPGRQIPTGVNDDHPHDALLVTLERNAA